jgi:hypothetical protein
MAKTLTELAKHYQKTGEYLPEASKAELEYVYLNISGWVDFWMKACPSYREGLRNDFRNEFGIRVGAWQSKNKFTRSARAIYRTTKKTRE